MNGCAFQPLTLRQHPSIASDAKRPAHFTPANLVGQNSAHAERPEGQPQTQACGSESAAPADVVPTANRGLKSPSNKLRESDEAQRGHIDFLTVTVPVAEASDLIVSQRRREMIRQGKAFDKAAATAALAVYEWLFGDTAIVISEDVSGFRSFYESHFKLTTPEGEHCGFIAFGGERQRGTCCIELTGAACAHVGAWAHVEHALRILKARITRIDVAHDDFEGAHTLDDALRWYEAGAFNTNGRPPAMQRVGWNDESGHTLYIGKNAGNQQLCVYEKGKQQGDPTSPWVRFEGRFGAKYRPIDLAIITNPVAYLCGHFPALTWISEATTRMATSIKRAAANFERASMHLRRQYGAVLNVIRSNSNSIQNFGERVAGLCRAAVPRWIGTIPHGTEAIAIALNPTEEPQPCA